MFKLPDSERTIFERPIPLHQTLQVTFLLVSLCSLLLQLLKRQMLLLLDQLLEQDLLRPGRGNADFWRHLSTHARVPGLQLLRL